MNAMKRFALLGTALMSFLTGCGTQQENTASLQPKAAANSGTVKEIAQTGMSTAVPDDYLQPIEQAGTVTQITYDSKDFVRDGSDITKTAYVYLPYGYDENDTETRYNICYLMHGWGGHAGEYFEYANITDMLDNMIAKGDIPPTIFVSATFYNDNSDTGFSGSVAEFRQFHRDFEEYLMPAVEGQFHTYAESTSPEDLKASRDHRAFGGFSLGSVTTWLQFCYDSDYIRCFLPMSGSCWYYGGYGDFQIEKNVDFIQQLVEDNDLDDRGYFIYHGVGTNDTVKLQSIDMAEEMLSRSDVFTPDHYVFYQREGGQHDHISCREFMYNALPLFFGGDTVRTDDVTENTTVGEVKNMAAFGDFGRLLFPVDRTVSDDMTLKKISNSSTYTWYNYIKPEKTVEIVNYLKNSAENGQQIFYNIYTKDEMQADSSLRDTGLFFFKGEDNAKFTVCNAGGGFAYVGAMHDSFPHGFGLGTGTVAEGWIYDAVNFWEEQFSGDIPTKREPANLQNWLLTKAKNAHGNDYDLNHDERWDVFDLCLMRQEVAESMDTADSNTLVVYYSASGTTEKIADYIVEAMNADTFVITPVQPYSDADLDWTDQTSRVVMEHNDENRHTELVSVDVPDWESYDNVFIGYPIWWREAAWVVDDFVKENDFTGKNVIPFCTSMSSPLGDSGTLLAEMAGTGNWLEGMRFTSSSTKETVQSWATGLDLPKQEQKNDILIAYFTPAENSGVDAISSATLTTWNGENMGAAQVLTNMIHDHTRSDMFSIRTEVNYPLEYNDLADYAKDEQDNDVLPALTSHIENLDQYSTIIVVFPDWWYTMPQAVYSFFDEYDLAGKTIIPCSTHAGSGLTGSPRTIRELEPDATIIDDGFTVAANRVTSAEDDVTAWAEKHELN